MGASPSAKKWHGLCAYSEKGVSPVPVHISKEGVASLRVIHHVLRCTLFGLRRRDTHLTKTQSRAFYLWQCFLLFSD